LVWDIVWQNPNWVMFTHGVITHLDKRYRKYHSIPLLKECNSKENQSKLFKYQQDSERLTY